MIFGDKKKDNKKFALIFVCVIPVLYFIVFTASDTVFGVDARYHLQYMWHSPWIANLTAVAVWVAVLLSFTLVNTKMQNPIFIGCLFLLNFMNIRLLMPDPDNYIFFLASVFIMLFLKNSDVRIRGLKIQPWMFGFAAIFPYLAYRGFVLVNIANATDLLPTPAVLLFFLPTYYLLIKQKNYLPMVFIVCTTMLFMTGKYTTNALPPFIYSLYLGFISSDMNIEKDKIIRFLIFLSLIGFAIVAFMDVLFPMMPVPITI
jgi:hypothetical protein